LSSSKNIFLIPSKLFPHRFVSFTVWNFGFSKSYVQTNDNKMHKIKDLLQKPDLQKEDIIFLLQTEGEEKQLLFEKAREIRLKYSGNKVYFRGLIEYSDVCAKNCYYCGIRRDNKKINRYTMSDEEVLAAAKYAYDNNFMSLVLQGGELSSPAFVDKISDLLDKIMEISNNSLGITLSFGEQSEETFRKWNEKGARRYLLRIESSNKTLYEKIHPKDALHSYAERIKHIHLLRKTGYQVGSGVMIGLPFQSIEDLADDLLFFREMDIDMLGMGPYVEHEDTPLFEYQSSLWSKEKRMDMTLKMLAILRIMMKDINMAATTAMQSIDARGREKAMYVSANVMMPNLTPLKYREGYLLYNNKPGVKEQIEDSLEGMEAQIKAAGCAVGYGEWGDSKHFKKRQKND
jgi:biotin synthase